METDLLPGRRRAKEGIDVAREIGASWLRFSKLARMLMRTVRLSDHPIDRMTIGFPDTAEKISHNSAFLMKA
jgi:hypothetical protein